MSEANAPIYVARVGYISESELALCDLLEELYVTRTDVKLTTKDAETYATFPDSTVVLVKMKRGVTVDERCSYYALPGLGLLAICVDVDKETACGPLRQCDFVHGGQLKPLASVIDPACAVCEGESGQKAVVIFPCRHTTCCPGCIEQLATPSCPTCRGAILSTIPLEKTYRAYITQA